MKMVKIWLKPLPAVDLTLLYFILIFLYFTLFDIFVCRKYVKSAFGLQMKATTAITIDTRYIKETAQSAPIIAKLNSLDRDSKGYKQAKENLLLKLDTSFPIRLRVTYNKVQKYYPLNYDLTYSQWVRMHGRRPEDLKETWLELSAIENKASEIIEKMRVFSFAEFKKRFDRTSTDTNLLSTAFSEYIKSLYEDDRVGTAISYTNAKNSLERFKKGLSFNDITPDTLKQYERWMLKQGNSFTTIGMYLRTLRSLFNKAIADGDIQQADYPFGNRKYTIPKGAGKKIALPISDIALINGYQAPENSFLEMTRDLFMFMYLANGINIKDTCLLKFSNIEGEYIRFKREKNNQDKNRSGTNSNPR